MATLHFSRSWFLTLAGLGLACAGFFFVLKRNEPEVSREVTIFFTLLYGLLLGAVLLLARKLRRQGAPRQGALDFYLTVGAALLVGVGLPLYGLVRVLIG